MCTSSGGQNCITQPLVLTNLMHKICFTVSLIHASTCFEHICSSSGGQNCITQSLVLANLMHKICFTVSLIHASTCFEHVCSSSGGQNCITQPLVLANLMHKICFTKSFISCLYMFRTHMLIIRRSKLHYTASGISQLDAQNLFHEKFYFMPLHVSSTCAHQQEVKIALHILWY